VFGVIALAGLRRPDALLSSSDSEDDWQAVDNVRFTVVRLINKRKASKYNICTSVMRE